MHTILQALTIFSEEITNQIRKKPLTILFKQTKLCYLLWITDCKYPSDDLLELFGGPRSESRASLKNIFQTILCVMVCVSYHSLLPFLLCFLKWWDGYWPLDFCDGWCGLWNLIWGIYWRQLWHVIWDKRCLRYTGKYIHLFWFKYGNDFNDLYEIFLVRQNLNLLRKNTRAKCVFFVIICKSGVICPRGWIIAVTFKALAFVKRQGPRDLPNFCVPKMS